MLLTTGKSQENAQKLDRLDKPLISGPWWVIQRMLLLKTLAACGTEWGILGKMLGSGGKTLLVPSVEASVLPQLPPEDVGEVSLSLVPSIYCMYHWQWLIWSTTGKRSWKVKSSLFIEERVRMNGNDALTDNKYSIVCPPCHMHSYISNNSSSSIMFLPNMMQLAHVPIDAAFILSLNLGNPKSRQSVYPFLDDDHSYLVQSV